MRSVALRVLVVLGACSRRDPAPPAPVKTAPDPWGAPADARPESEAERAHRIEGALAHVGELAPKVAKLRALAFAHDVPHAYQDPAAFHTFARAEIAKDLPHPAETGAALYHVGLLPTKVDLAAVEELALASGAGAYYNSTEKRFYLLLAPDGFMFDGLVVHELVHALQDQHFDLDRLLPRDTLDADHLIARRFVAEGDATFTMFLFALVELRGAATPEMVRLLRGQLAQLVRMSPGDMVKQNVLGLAASVDPGLSGALVAIEDIPLTVLVPLFDSYIYGAELVAGAYERGGWKAVDALYADPPASTEQVLHPTTKLYPRREPPIQIDLTAPANETVLADLVFGELQWQVYFQLWAPAQRIVASEGWGGDHVVVTRQADGGLCARIATAWDTRADADEFRAAYVASLTKRFPRGSGDASASFVRGDGAGHITLRQDGARVMIVDGQCPRAALDELGR
jgi:hypothetical protein